MKDVEDLIKKLTGDAFNMKYKKLSQTEYGMSLPVNAHRHIFVNLFYKQFLVNSLHIELLSLVKAK